MFGLSIAEIGIILVVLLLVFGPDKLPELARNMGKVMGAIKQQSDSIRREFYNSVYKPAEDFQNRVVDSGRSLILDDELIKTLNKKDPLCPDNQPKPESTEKTPPPVSPTTETATKVSDE